MLLNLRLIFKPPPKQDGFNVSNYMYSIMVPLLSILLLQGTVGIVYFFVIKDSSVLYAKGDMKGIIEAPFLGFL